MDTTTLNDHHIDPSLRQDQDQDTVSHPQSLFQLGIGILGVDDKNDIILNEAQQAELDEVTASAITASLSHPLPHPSEHDLSNIPIQDINNNNDSSGSSDDNPIISPSPHIAPFSRPARDENTPHPLYIQFPVREEFEAWLEGESSWCHFVQRRSTTPEKRAEERLKAREKAYERLVSGMQPDQAASTPPLKRRRRIRTSAILEKVTYTCHHAGKYNSKHSDTLPQAKLRLNTKKTVKCDCTSRIVLNEMESKLCKVVYYWRHERHDPFADNEHNSGRLPKVIDDWLIAQIEAGRDTESIRKSLLIPDREREEYLQKVAADPNSIDPDMPPPLAFSLKIKYPDIYNRYRKLRGPIKSTKVLKTRRNKAESETKDFESGEIEYHDSVDPTLQSQHVQVQSQDGLNESQDGGLMYPHFDSSSLPPMELGGNDELPEGLAELASQGHEGLARALLHLPRNGLGDGQELQLDDNVLRMDGGDGVPGTAWDAMGI